MDRVSTFFRNIFMSVKVHLGITGPALCGLQRDSKKNYTGMKLEIFFFSWVSDDICSWQNFTLAWTKSHYSPLLLYGIPSAEIVMVPIPASAPGSKTPTGTCTFESLKHTVCSWGLLDDAVIFQHEILPLWITELTVKCCSGHTFSLRKKQCCLIS